MPIIEAASETTRRRGPYCDDESHAVPQLKCLARQQFRIAVPGLNCRAFFLAELRESLALSRQALKYGPGLPVFTLLPGEFRHAVVNAFQTEGIRVPHRAAALGRETVAVEINNVYVRSAQRVTFFENARTFVDQGIHAAINNLAGGYFALRNALVRGPLARERSDFRIARSLSFLVV